MPCSTVKVGLAADELNKSKEISIETVSLSSDSVMEPVPDDVQIDPKELASASRILELA